MCSVCVEIIHKTEMKKIVACFLLLLPFCVQAQTVMSLDECIAKALENNFSLKMSYNREEIAKNNYTIAPFLPSVGVTGTQRQSVTDSRRTLAATETSADVNGARSDNYSAGISLNYRLFDGLSMFATYCRSKGQWALAEQNKKIAVENLVAQVCLGYYNIVVLENRLTAAKYSLSLSNQRYDQMAEKYELGSSSGLDVRQAKIDVNTDSSKLMRQVENIKNAYIRFDKLMNADFEKISYIQDSITLLPRMAWGVLVDDVQQYNNVLIAARVGQQISEEDLRIARALRFPTLDFSSGYTYNRSETPAGATTFSESNGYNWGFSLSWPIFDRMETRRKISNAKIEMRNSELNYLNTENEVMGDLSVLYNTYINNLQMIEFETESAETALLTLDAAMERYKLGDLSGIEFREYQKNYLDAVDRKLEAMYQAKVSEINLRLMSGEITGR